MEIRTMILLGVVLAILAGFGYCGWRIKDLKHEISKQETQITQLKADVETAVSINVNNQTVIRNLRNDQVVSESIIKETKRKNEETIKALSVVSSKVKESSDNTVAAPILTETVQSIVKARK